MTTRIEQDGQFDPILSSIMGERRHLINLADRLLGSLADAEDVVQDAYARWYAMPPQQQEAIETPAAWLTTDGAGVPGRPRRSRRHPRNRRMRVAMS